MRCSGAYLIADLEWPLSTPIVYDNGAAVFNRLTVRLLFCVSVVASCASISRATSSANWLLIGEQHDLRVRSMFGLGEQVSGNEFRVCLIIGDDQNF